MTVARLLPVAVLALLAAFPLSAQSGPRPLSLEEALQRARPTSEAVAIARLDVDRARGERMVARSALLPQIGGSFSYNRQLRSQFQGLLGDQEPDTASTPRPTSCDGFAPDPTRPIGERLAALEAAVECATTVDPFGSFSQLPFGRANTYTLGLSGSQVLFDGGRIFGRMKAADGSRAAAEIGVSSAEARVVLDVVQAYYDAALADRLVVIAEATLAQTDTTLRQTRLARDVGTAPEFDLLRAAVARDNQVPVVIDARTRRDLAHIRLRQLLDLPTDQPLELTTTLADTSLRAVPTLAGLVGAAPDTSTGRRAPVRQAVEAIRIQEGLDQAARGARLPSVSLTTQYSRLAYPSRGLPGWDEFVTDWSLGLGVQIPIFTGGRLKGDRIQARAGLEQARLVLRQTEEAAHLDARNTMASLDGALANWQASQGTTAQATRAYQIAEIRFREGISTQTELLDARIALQQAEVNQARAARDLQVARVRAALLSELPLDPPAPRS